MTTATINPWFLAVRPKTLPAAVVPVCVGAATSAVSGGVHWTATLAALGGALLLQIGSNFANDVFDYEKGADTAERVGPMRAVASGLISPQAMKRGMWLVFLVALLLGVYLTVVAGPVIVAIGLLSITAAIAYTGGPYPLGYNGLGELFVMIFFGFVAVCGTQFVNTASVSELSVWASVPIGALASAILVVNNVRDEPLDRRVGKRTLVVRLGRQAGLWEYRLLLLAAYAMPAVVLGRGLAGPLVLLPWLTAPLGVTLARRVSREHGPSLNSALARTAQLLLLFGLLLALGIVLGARSDAH